MRKTVRDINGRKYRRPPIINETKISLDCKSQHNGFCDNGNLGARLSNADNREIYLHVKKPVGTNYLAPKHETHAGVCLSRMQALSLSWHLIKLIAMSPFYGERFKK